MRVGIYSSIASGFLAELLRAYGQRHGKVRIDLIDGNAAEHVTAIRQLRLDFAFLSGGQAGSTVSVSFCGWSGVFVASPVDHALAAREELSWQDLAEETFIVCEVAPGQEIHDHLVRCLADLVRHPDIEVQQIGRDNLLPLVALGQGLTLVSEAMTVARLPGIFYRPIAG